MVLNNCLAENNLFERRYRQDLEHTITEVDELLKKLRQLKKVVKCHEDLGRIERERGNLLKDLDQVIQDNEDVLRVTERAERAQLMRNLFARFSLSLIAHSELIVRIIFN